MTSRMLPMPVRYMTQRSKPRPKPAWRGRTVLAQIQIEARNPLPSGQAHPCGCGSVSRSSSRWLPPMISPMPGTRQSTGSDGLAVRVQLHVEGLDLLRVIRDENGTLGRSDLGEVALVLCLQVAAPMDRILELVIVRLEQGNGLGVGHMAEVGRS